MSKLTKQYVLEFLNNNEGSYIESWSAWGGEQGSIFLRYSDGSAHKHTIHVAAFLALVRGDLIIQDKRVKDWRYAVWKLSNDGKETV